MEIKIDRSSIEESTIGATVLVVVDGVNQFVEVRRSKMLRSHSTRADYGRSNAQLLALHINLYEEVIRQNFSKGPTGIANMVALTI